MNRKEIHDAIFNYHWMIRLLINKKAEMTGVSQTLIAKYGIEANMPKGKGTASDPVFQEILRIERYERNTERIRKKVQMIQKHSKAITNIKEQLILDMLLDGMSLREIASKLDMSLAAVNRKKDEIVDKIYLSIQSERMEQTERTEQSEQTERMKKICV